MLDPKLFRNNLDGLVKELKSKNFDLDIAFISSLEGQRKSLQIKVQELQHTRNTLSKEIGQLKGRGDNADLALEKVTEVSNELKQLDGSLDEIQDKLSQYYLTVPNLLDQSVPNGSSEDDNREERTWGELPKFDFQPKQHLELETSLELMDFELSARLTGSRFVVLHQQLAKLHRGLIQFMLDVHTLENDYQEIYVPYIVNDKTLEHSGQLPKFKDDLFQLEGSNYYLIPTAEVPVTNVVAGKILDEATLPLKYVCHTPCFRKEAGTYGKDMHGMIRQHQFEKVEMVCITTPEQSNEILEKLTLHAEGILQKLNLPYRVMTLCSADIGFAATKTYDIEVWLPGQNKYREISSCSNCGDFQARRMHARFRANATSKPELVHTLNGSGLAVGRTLLAILENYQQQDGTVKIPGALLPYMHGLTQISI